MNRELALSLLNLSNGFTDQQLKESFKKEAYKWHPDRNKSDNASDQFKLRLDAYNFLLSDKGKEKKTRYVNRQQNNFKKQFHRPLVDKESETYQKIKKVSAILFGTKKVDEVEKTVFHTQQSLDEIFDLLGIDK